jgi:glutamine amidotransferase
MGSTKQEYAFAHNGTLTHQENLKLRNFTTIGETDSEHTFCYILDAIADREIDEWTDDDFAYIENLFRSINDGQNTINCIFSDGEYLFCYSDENDHNNGLRYVRHTQPFGKIELLGAEEKFGSIDIRSNSRTTSQTGYIISTRILTKEAWTEFDNGELIVFREGEIVYPGDRIAL